MPKGKTKRTKSKKFVKKGKSKRFFKSADKRGEVMINKTPAKAHTVIAPRYLTRITTIAQGNMSLALTSPTGYNNIVFAIGHNTVGNPWILGDHRSIGPVTGKITAPFVGGSGGAATYTANSNLITDQSLVQPMGFVNPLLNMYRQFRVLASKIRVTCVPTGTNTSGSNIAGLTGTLIVYPQRVNSNVSGSNATFLATNDPIEAMNIPFAKWKAFQAGDDIKNNTIEIYMDSPTLLGMSKKEYKIRSDVIQQYSDTSNDVTTPSLVLSPTIFTYTGGSSTVQSALQGTIWTIMICPSTAQDLSNYTLDIQVDYYLQCENPIQNLGINDDGL